MKKIFQVLTLIVFFALPLVLVGCGEEKVDDRLVVTFDCDGGSAIENARVNSGECVGLNALTTKEGYVFVTWLLDNYEFDFTTPVTENITLTAVWVKEVDADTEAVIYFDSDGGTYVKPIVVTIGDKIEEPTQPEKLGYKFEYWIDEYNNKRFIFSNGVEEETYLTAYYTAKKKIAIKFDSDGGTEIDETFVYYGDKIGTLPKPTKEGYLFVGWKVNGSFVDESLTPTLATTLKAFYVEIGDGTKVVTFLNKDGSVIEAQTVKMGEAAVAPTATFEGYTFVSWDKDFSYIYEDMEVHAQYKINTYLVQFKDDLFNFVYDNQYIDYQESATAPYVKDRDNMVFSGWDRSFDCITSDIVVKAIWATNESITDDGKIEHTFNLINASYSGNGSGSKLSLITGEDSLGTTISWSSDNKAVISDDGTITRCYVKTTVTLTATVYAGNKSKSNTYEYVVPRTTMDLTTGVSAGYLFSEYQGDEKVLLETFDIYYLAFANFNNDGTVTSLGDMGNYFVKNCIDKVHERGCYVVPSFRTTETFVKVATNQGARIKFADSIVEMINKYDLDGVDIDWEYPKEQAEVNGFGLMMKEIYAKVKANNPKHIVTCAILISGLYNFNLNTNIKYMDYVNMMSYEMHSTSVATHHTALYSSSKGGGSIVNAVARFTSTGVPLNKIIIGAAFFGRQYTNSKGLGTSATYVSDALRYSTIKNYVNNQTDTLKRYWDNEAKAPYIYDSSSGFLVTYDDPESIGYKVDYVVSKKLGGLMCWQTGQDNGDLVQAFKDNYKKLKQAK